LKKTLLIILVLCLTTPLLAKDKLGGFGLDLGLGVGILNTFSDTLPEDTTGIKWLGNLELGFSAFNLIGVRAELTYSSFFWEIENTDGTTTEIPMVNSSLSVDLYGIIPLGEGFRLRPGVGYTLDSSLADSLSIGFLGAQGIHASLKAEFQLNSITWVGLSTGYQFTGKYEDITLDDDRVPLPSEVDASFFELTAQITFSMR